MQTFDTHEYIKDLQDANVPLKQAEAHSKALKRIFDLDEIATKRDLNDLETRLNVKIKDMETRFNAKIKDMETRLNAKMDNRINELETRLTAKIDANTIALIKWLIPLLLGQTALIFALIKFFNSASGG